ncbi:crinkler (CRN) family protein, putative [Rhizophagus clarus]|uniref:Crinkler (CRN) family protein, putative n=1 Tax=Rhizophagus clarus TaxID=94130 RepID=A0A8H3QWY4_9GLOM|nr:crinkler (CRN) family protein, putative [Rhizophagus clarus]
MSEKSDGLIKYELLNTHHEKSNPLRDPFPIDISEINVIDDHHPRVSIEHLSVGHLKSLINNKKSLVSDSDNLTLWNVEGLAEGNDKWGILEQIVTKELNNETSTKQKLKELGAKVLNSSRLVKNIFSVVPKEHVHIIVETSPPATTEQRPTKRLKSESESETGVGDPSFNDLLEVVSHLKRKLNWEGGDFIEHPTGKDLPIVQQPKLYIRQDYKELYEIVNNKELDPKFLINGTSGIGKSCFLLYLLIRILCSSDDATIIFQTTQSNIFYCFKKSKLDVGLFEDISYYLYDPDTWYLADAIPPRPKLRARTVLAVSPVSYKENKNFDEFSKVVVNKYCMAPWIMSELEVCREHIFPDVPKDLMLKLYDKAGGVPRYVLEMPKTQTKQNDSEEIIIQKSLSRIKGSILSIANFNELLLCFTNKADYVKISSCIIHRWPDSSYDYDNHSLHWASNYIYEEIIVKLEQNRWDKLLQRIRNHFDPSNARGLLFETYVLNIFKQNDNFEIRCLQETENEERYLRILGFEKYTYIRTAEDLSKYNKDNIPIRPTVKNFGAVDLILTQDKIFQITVSNKHPIKQNEIVKVIQNMPAFKRGNKIRLFFVVPDDIYNGFTYQNYVTERKDKDKDIDDKDPDELMFRSVKQESPVLKFVEQWVLKVDLSVK